jgi:antibiotic biosynthesis monooxygenase (ABM) superfamily enzyme
MTWLVMPRVTWLLHRWLYPDPITQAGPDDEVEA